MGESIDLQIPRVRCMSPCSLHKLYNLANLSAISAQAIITLHVKLLPEMSTHQHHRHHHHHHHSLLVCTRLPQMLHGRCRKVELKQLCTTELLEPSGKQVRRESLLAKKWGVDIYLECSAPAPALDHQSV